MIERNTIFITGAASGLGRETARLFAAKGWFVGGTDINGPGLEALTGELGSDALYTANHDVTDRAAWTHAVDGFAEATGGRMDLFFNNAGIGIGGPFEQVPEEGTARVIAINFEGVVHGVYACFPFLKETAQAKGRATLVNMGSAAGLVSPPGAAIYGATKFAVRGLTEALYGEFARFGIRVCELQPAFLDTAILDSRAPGDTATTKDLLTQAKVPILPASVVSDAIWQIAHDAKPKVHYALGGPAKQLQFLARFLPKTLRARVRKTFEAGLARRGTS